MVATVMCKPRLIDDLLPSGIDVLRDQPRSQRSDDGIESGPGDLRHRPVRLIHAADMNEPPKRRMVARHASRELEKGRLA